MIREDLFSSREHVVLISYNYIICVRAIFIYVWLLLLLTDK